MGLGGPNSSGRSINRSVARLMGPDPLLGCEPRTLPLFDEASELCVFSLFFGLYLVKETDFYHFLGSGPNSDEVGKKVVFFRTHTCIIR